MTAPFALRLARREARSGGRRIGACAGAIALGVAALVAINSFRAAAVASIEAEANALLGADLRLHASRPFPPAVQAVLDSVQAAGVGVSYVTRLASMVRATRSGGTRLLQVHAIHGGYPYYGDVATEPAGLWPLGDAERRALVEPAALVQLDAAVGDTLAIGDARFVIAGTVDGLGIDVGFQSAIGPRVYIPAAFLEETGLVRLGSLVRYQAYLHFGDAARAEAFLDANDALLRASRIGRRTVADQADDLTDALGTLGRYLGLVGLMAVLLGGIGVASAVHAYVRDKVPQVAVLRCLGATRRSVFGVYLLQTGALGVGGAAAGAALGVAVQAALPALLGDALPVDVAFRVHWPAVLGGLAAGAGVAVVFALLPLLAVRDVPPLQALRRDVEPARRRADPWRLAAYAALAASVLVLSIAQAPGPAAGLAFAAGTGAALGLLALVGLGLARAARRLLPRRAGFAVRQGVANLFRPRNQTAAVMLSIGLGVFLLATLHLVQANLLDRFRVEAGDGANLLLFDLQTDQLEEVRAFLADRGVRLEREAPLVPARIAAIGGRPATELLADTSDSGPERWALRREYRNTYREDVAETETVVAGEWWGRDGERSGAGTKASTGEGRAGEAFAGGGWSGDALGGGAPRHGAARPARISVEEELAGELGVGLGDRITWDVQGVLIETEVANLRRVDWARFAPNFFVVFEPGVLEAAPQTFIALARVPDATQRAELQRELARRWPNVSALDLAVVREALDDIVGKATLAIRFLALFAIGGGLVVLAGSLSTTRFQRMREIALLRTLGASRAQLRRVLLVEHLALGAAAGLAGAVLAGAAAAALTVGLFELEFRLPVAALVIAWAATASLTAALGYLHSRDLLRRPPLAVLREVDRG
ncbi:MAG TPA: FtsX-like permease family protein [Longimicrobiales bacterium]